MTYELLDSVSYATVAASPSGYGLTPDEVEHFPDPRRTLPGTRLDTRHGR
jgi:hypothetical protein